ncbi:DUF4097 family beta strand repeat protein [Nostocoides sp. F2B08]|uniref:DUF4097 family beta strand repeat-containing protein n=1 Tax=Nostocoides sp. F2B08 TaxID=2653936 RepID=UPI0012630A57|nr:DUF4097 family beta strand repeat-containing protein [Tetrasphaera sp. F2B08]KAB7742410.1 DUF4097 family beta strand repeat protein [Tetrasphaera sp. F2B08]
MNTATSTARTHEFTDIGALRLTNERGDVRVGCTSPDGVARVRLSARADIDLDAADVRSEDGTLIVDIPVLTDPEGPAGVRFRLGPLSVDTTGSSAAAVDVEIELPAGSDIRARTKLGDVVVSGEAGDVSTRTGAGDVTVERAGRVRIGCGSGRVSVRSCRGGDITTGAGDITVEDVDGPELNCRAGSGSVRLPNSRTQKVTVTTGSGDVTVHLGQGTFEGRSGTGDIETVVPRGIPVWLDLTSGLGRVSKDLESVGAPEEGQEHLTVRVRTGVGSVLVRN